MRKTNDTPIEVHGGWDRRTIDSPSTEGRTSELCSTKSSEGHARSWEEAWARTDLARGADSTAFHCGEICIDLEAHVAWLPSGPIGLRPLEEDLLKILWQSANRVVPTQQLVTSLYGNLADGPGRIRLRRLVADIRNRLGADVASRLCTAPKRGLVLYVNSAGAIEDS